MHISRRKWLGGVGAAGVAGFATAHAAPLTAADEIIAAERAFDAYTAVHGYHRGFALYSTPESVGFNPQIFPYHTSLQQVLNQTPPPPEASSKLRWWPYRVGVSRSGDLGFDLGGWRIDGEPGGGWFFTVWSKQAQGGWLWPLDAGAGRTDDAALLPKDGDLLIDPLPAKGARLDHAALDAAHNSAITRDGPVKASLSTLTPQGVVSSNSDVPALTEAAQITVLKKRPLSGYITRGGGISAVADIAYAYGECLDASGAFIGAYIRLWRQEANGPRLVIDLYHAP